MKKLVVVLTKYPESWKVKTRLAKDIWFKKSAKVQKLFIKNILNNNYFKQSNSYDFKICLKESEKINDFVKDFWVKKYDIFSPDWEDLWKVMISIFEKSLLKYEEVILIWSDIPLLNKDNFLNAFDVLANNDFVLWPALDWGYYLIWMKKLKSYIFENIVFSTIKVLNETIKKIQKQWDSFVLLEQKRDIDELDDLIEESKVDQTWFFKTIINIIDEK